MHRDHGFAKSNLKVLVSALIGFSMAGTVWVFVSNARMYMGEFSPSKLWTDMATMPIVYSVPVALLVAWGLHYWHNRHPVDLILLGDKDRLTPVKITPRTSTMERDHPISMRSLKVAASLLAVSLAIAAGLIFVFSPSGLGTDMATALALYTVPPALVIAWGLHYWHNRHPVGLILLGDKDDRLTPVNPERQNQIFEPQRK